MKTVTIALPVPVPSGKNWKTTLAGVCTASGLALEQVQLPYTWAPYLSKFLIVLGTLLLGIFAKDSNVTGGTVNQMPPVEVDQVLVEDTDVNK